MTESGKSVEGVRAVGRALEILLAFTPQDGELTVAQLLKRVDLNRATLYRLLYTLEEWGFVQAEGDPQRYRLGPSVARLSHAWSSGLDLVALAQPVLQQVWDDTRETVALFVPQEGLRLCVAELPSPQPLKFKRGVGYTEQIARGASGRAILAWLMPIDEAVARHGAGAVLDSNALAKELALTRQRGYGVSYHELIEGAVALAAPFFDRSGQVAGSLGIFGPAVRLPKAKVDTLGPYLAGQARELSGRLGYQAVPTP
ncbi:MAG: IclR family transcriptional regulator [Pigmentiphaga sp.]|nr:IclR family transcriptional regulator [Pigmentiphaga sp.]